MFRTILGACVSVRVISFEKLLGVVGAWSSAAAMSRGRRSRRCARDHRAAQSSIVGDRGAMMPHAHV